MTVADFAGNYCESCPDPRGSVVCEGCATDDFVARMREWLLRQKTVAPGLTNAEVAIVERLIADLESA